MNSFKNACILFVAFCLSGCVMFSGSVSDEIRMDSQSIKEFDLTVSNRISAYDGNFTGVISQSNKEYKQYVFPTALKGKGPRSLRVLVPEVTDEEYGEAKITETINKLPKKASAKLIIMCSSNLNPNDFLNRNKDHIDISESNDHTIIIRKPYSGIEFDRLYFIRERTGGNISWREVPAEISLSWNIRDIDEVNGKKMRFFYTIPLDIITSPIQLFLILTWGMWE